AATDHVVKQWGGDPKRMVLCGFSRGAIATSYIGLRDDELASRWCGLFSHSHYDGVRTWPYADSDARSAIARIQRFQNRPQWISHEQSVERTEKFFRDAGLHTPQLTFQAIPYPNHSVDWLLKDLPQRDSARRWLRETVGESAVDPANAVEPADLVVMNGKIVTLDALNTQCEALAVRDGRIIATGTNAEIGQWIGKRKVEQGNVEPSKVEPSKVEPPKAIPGQSEQRSTMETVVLDAMGKLVIPGFNDSHVHFLAGGQQLSSVQLRDAQTPAEFTARLKEFALRSPAGTWITGGDWDHENWASGELPTRAWIDAVTSAHPVMVRRLDGHMALANSFALKLAGITRESADVPGGLIVRDASGEPTGILKDAAMNAVYAVIPAMTHAERLRAAQAATDHAAMLGVTSVQDMSGDSDVIIYQELLRQGNLKTRIYAAAPLPNWEKSAARGFKAAFGDDWIRQGGLKGFADGSLGSTTAYFFEAYNDDPRTSGLPSDEMFPSGAMLRRAIAADKAGLQLMIHAIGDRANDEILSIYEQMVEQNGVRDRRARIEHAQHLRLTDIPRFAKHNIIASMQPYHCADDGRWAEKRIGAERAQGTYAFRSLIDAGVTLAFGSDWNVAPLDPMQGIAAAVTRQTLDGRHPQGWVPQQKINVMEAVRAYTVGSAKAEFSDATKGSLSVGKLADLVILSQDIFTVPPQELSKTRVTNTVVHGRVVYSLKND
ncbi:MAG: amidohydrolase, partial [Pirellulaceae bacterium]|nr:amidohydrolase [Pirellulaceae bacterium]